jgi:hypothetical protein
LWGFITQGIEKHRKDFDEAKPGFWESDFMFLLKRVALKKFIATLLFFPA